METYTLVAVKRDWVPDWLYWLLCRRLPFFGQITLIHPIRWILHRDVEA